MRTGAQGRIGELPVRAWAQGRMAGCDGDMAGAAQAATREAYIQVHVVSPQGEKHPLMVRAADDVATLRALCTQMFDVQDWTTVQDKREDRQEYSDILDEDTGFSEVIALQANPDSKQQSFLNRFSGKPRTWLEWADKKGKLRLMCGAYTLEDGKCLEYYHIKNDSVIHPLYERYGDTLDASAAMLVDPSWYKQQLDQARSLAHQVTGAAGPGWAAPAWGSVFQGGSGPEGGGGAAGAGAGGNGETAAEGDTVRAGQDVDAGAGSQWGALGMCVSCAHVLVLVPFTRVCARSLTHARTHRPWCSSMGGGVVRLGRCWQGSWTKMGRGGGDVGMGR